MVYLKDLDRVVEGYNLPFVERVFEQIYPTGSVQVAAPLGPGRVESLQLAVLTPPSSHFSTYPADTLIITIDGVTFFDDLVFAFVPLYSNVSPQIGPTFGWKYVVNQIDMVDFKLNLDYEVSLVVKLICGAGASNLLHQIILFGRRGY